MSVKKAGDFMFVVGFYSPKPKSGVTELSLSVFHWLNNNSDLSVSYISNDKLEIDKHKNIVDNFSSLSLPKQIQKINSLKKKFDVIVYDASNGINHITFKVLPVVDRLFVLGEENIRFTEILYEVLHFNKTFDKESKRLISFVEGAYILENEKSKLGFTDKSADAEKICEMIQNDFLIISLQNTQNIQFERVIKKIVTRKDEYLTELLYDLGFDFNKSLLFEKFIQLRQACGQDFVNAARNLFPLFMQWSYQELLKEFQDELYVAQINFKATKPSSEEGE